MDYFLSVVVGEVEQDIVNEFDSHWVPVISII